jgi:hypothetical protein
MNMPMQKTSNLEKMKDFKVNQTKRGNWLNTKEAQKLLLNLNTKDFASARQAVQLLLNKQQLDGKGKAPKTSTERGEERCSSMFNSPR